MPRAAGQSHRADKRRSQLCAEAVLRVHGATYAPCRANVTRRVLIEMCGRGCLCSPPWTLLACQQRLNTDPLSPVEF
jgi:hypothetical protein